MSKLKGIKMNFKDLTKAEIRECFNNIDKYLMQQEKKFVKYVDLGCKVVRLIGYSEEFLPHIEKQLTFVLRDTADKYDATLILWKENNAFNFGKNLLPKFNPKTNMRLRIDLIYFPKTIWDIRVIDESISKVKPVIDVKSEHGIILANDYENNTYYYGVNNLEPEEFIKEGHLFVQFFNNILKTPTSNLAHGAVIGLNGNGILMCARGQRGKSTLAVLSMMKGFEYVSDDYLILHERGNELLSSPIYSIITLSPKMYNELYDYLGESRFVSNNARKDKYVFNIANFHDKFKMNYPIKIAIFPEIVTDEKPSIRPCTSAEKGRAMVHLIQSTLCQTNDLCENWTVKKMMDMIKDLPFYKFNLCHNIDANTEFLREFMNNLEKQENRVIEADKIAIDITFDLANILNTETGIIYSMNEFATNIYENLLNGVSDEEIAAALEIFEDKNENIQEEFKIFLNALIEKGIFKNTSYKDTKACINEAFAIKNNYKLSFIEHAEEERKQLIKIEEIKEKENELCIK